MRRELIAQFGPARLVRYLDGHHELIGGTEDHRATAREWCSLFAPEVVFNSVSLRKERFARQIAKPRFGRTHRPALAT